MNIVDERAQDLQSFQVKLLSELDEELKILAGEVAESCTYCMLLLDELSQYLRSDDEVVTCGLTAVSKEDAIDRTQKLVNNSRLRIVALNQQIAAIEEERAALIAFEQEAKAEKAPVALELVSAVTVLVGAYS